MPAVDAPQQQQPMEALSQEGIVTQQVVSIPVFLTLSPPRNHNTILCGSSAYLTRFLIGS